MQRALSLTLASLGFVTLAAVLCVVVSAQAEDVKPRQVLFTNVNIFDGVKGDWQRVENVQARGRGGVLAMATVLASQSGASRRQ